MYDANVGRFLSKDPMGQFYSPYIGMGNDPINGVDPTGGLFGGAGIPEGSGGEATPEAFPSGQQPVNPNRDFTPNGTSTNSSNNRYFGLTPSTLNINTRDVFNASYLSTTTDQTIEDIIRYVNDQPVGFTLTGKQIADKNSNLSEASGLVNSIVKVNQGVQLNLTWAGRSLISVSPHTIPDGSVFSLGQYQMKVGTKMIPVLKISSPNIKIFGKYSSVYIQGNTYSFQGTYFNPIFK